MDFKQRLAWAMRQAGIETPTELGRRARPQIPSPTMGAYARGERQPKIEPARAMARALKVNSIWLKTGEGSYDDPEEETSEHPIVGYVGAGGETNFERTDLGSIELLQRSPSTVAVAIRGDSLGHRFDGWYAVYDDVHHPVTATLNGKLCVVGTEDGRTLIKWVYDAGGGRHMLVSGNGEIEPSVALTWGAEVLTMQPKRRLR